MITDSTRIFFCFILNLYILCIRKTFKNKKKLLFYTFIRLKKLL